MSMIAGLSLTLCYVSVAVTIISLFLPQKRTRKIFSFVIGIFMVCSLIYCVSNTSIQLSNNADNIDDYPVPEYSEEAYNAQIMQATVENLVEATDEILRAEGIEARDIQISLKISEAGRIYIEDAVIYISEADFPRIRDVESIVYRNLSKEPRVYVEKEVERTAWQ